MAQRGGNKRYHAHGPRSGRERPPGRGDARRVGGVARAGGPGVAVAPASSRRGACTTPIGRSSARFAS